MHSFIVCGIISSLIYFLLFNTLCLYLILLFISIYFLLMFTIVPKDAFRFNSIRRKIQISTWSDPVRPTMLASIQIRASPSLFYISPSGTLTHLIVKSIGHVLLDFPNIIGKISLGHFIPCSRIDASCLVSLDEGNDVFFANIKDVPNKPLDVISQEIKSKAESLRGAEAKNKYKKMTARLDSVPSNIVSVLLDLLAFFTIGLGIPAPGLEGFGCFIVSSLGMHSVETAYAPLTPMVKCPLMFCINSVMEAAVVDNGKVVVEKTVNICLSADMRYMDGVEPILILERLKDVLEDPKRYLGNR